MNIASDPKSISSVLSAEANQAAALADATGVLTVDLDAIVANWRKLEKTAVPAHSAGTAVFSSLRQLATLASRSTVSTPVASASAAAWLASAESTLEMDFGSEAIFIARFYALAPHGSTGQK